MNKRVRTLLGFLAFGVLFAGAIFAYNMLIIGGSEPVNLARRGFEPGAAMMPAPDFVVQDINGIEFDLAHFSDKPIVLNFWASWCPRCIEEMPYFQQLFWSHFDEINMVKVNLLCGERETIASAMRALTQHDFTFQTFFDETGEAQLAYQVTAIPVTVFINSDGYIRYRVHGPINEESLQRGLDMILG